MRSALVLVRVVAGLEWVLADEVTAAGHRVVEVSKRQVIVEPRRDGIVGEPPRVADDLFEVYGAVPDPGRSRAGLVGAVRAAVERAPVGRGAFAVSASFVGVRNFNRYDVEDAVGERIARLTGGRYHSRRHGAVPPHGRTEWRVVLDGKTLWIAIRPYAVPLHRRPWRQHTVPGSLHPPVAAAMARLSNLVPKQQVLDPFCGAGTLLLEAHHLEPHARYLGVDRDPAATAAARANSSAAAGTTHRRGDGSGNERRDALGGAKHHREEHGAERRAGVRGARHSEGAGVVWRCGDARWVEGAFDRVLSNPPWGVRVADADFPAVVRRWRDVLLPGGLLAAILMPEQAERIGRGWRVRARYEIAVAGRHPVILVAEPARA